MTTALTEQISREAMQSLQTEFVHLLRRRQVQARCIFRHKHNILDSERREELTAEAVALSWRAWLQAYANGKAPENFSSNIMDFCCRHVMQGRKLAGADMARGIHNPVTQRREGFLVANELPPDRDDDVSILANLPAGTHTPTFDQVQFRHDFQLWLDQLGEPNASIAQELGCGDRTKDVAARHNVTPGAISQKRATLHRSWSELMAEKPPRER